MPAYTLSGFSIRPPEGLTPGGRLHRFQQATVDRLEVMAREVGMEAIEALQVKMGQTFNQPDATGRLARSLKMNVKADRDEGVYMSISWGAFREAQYITNMGGGQWRSGPYPITAKNAKNMIFWWVKENRLFKGQRVMHPGFPQGDIPLSVMANYVQIFQNRAIQTVGRGLVELTSGSQKRANMLRPITRSYKR